LDGGTHLFALAGIWPTNLRMAFDRQQHE
jgi:hypothetical protein